MPVIELLEEYLRGRCAEAARLHGTFRKRVAGAVADFVLGGGKRLRPRFVLAGWQAASGNRAGDRDAVWRAAAALELLQACALIQDDVMDGSAWRRGRSSLHVDLARYHREHQLAGDADSFGAKTAVLAGDLALAWADDLFADCLSTGQAGNPRAQQVWAAMRTEMVAGQFLDLLTQAEGAPVAADALRVAYLKSGLYSVERPLQLGAVLAGGCGQLVQALRDAGREAGLAFQLREDVLAVFGDPRRTGKTAGEDVAQGKATYLAAIAVRKAEECGDTRALAFLRDGLGGSVLDADRLARYRWLLTELGALAAVENEIARHCREAVGHVHAGVPDPAAAEELSGLFRAAAGTTHGDAVNAPSF